MMHPAISAILLITLCSALGAWWLSAGKTVERPVRVMLMTGYFWLLAFIQLLLGSIGYYVWEHYLNK